MARNEKERERLAKIETIIKQHEKRMEKIELTVDNLENHISELRESLAVVSIRIDELGKRIESSNKKVMWTIGLILTGVNILIQLIPYLLG